MRQQRNDKCEAGRLEALATQQVQADIWDARCKVLQLPTSLPLCKWRQRAVCMTAWCKCTFRRGLMKLHNVGALVIVEHKVVCLMCACTSSPFFSVRICARNCASLATLWTAQ